MASIRIDAGAAGVLVALATLATPAAAQSTTGQSAVTLGGVVDLAARYTDNSNGRQRSLASGSNSTSRIVFRGVEDLGDGLRASFWLEGSIFADTGTTGQLTIAPTNQFFDRQATVSVANRFGELQLGRVWTPVFLGFAYSDPWIFVGVGSMGNFFNPSVSTVFSRAFGSAANPTTISRASNSIGYILPPGLGGVNGQAMVAASEGNNAGGGFRYQAARLGYRGRGIDSSVYYGATRIDATGEDLKQAGVYASYDWKPVKLMGGYTDSRYLGSKQSHVIVGLTATFGQWIAKASYNRADQRGRDAAGARVDANDADQYALGLDYYLSKRTVVYSTVARLDNDGAARFSIPGGLGVVAPGSHSSGFELGVRHSF